MSSVDSRIVTMKFDNQKFNSGVTDTLGALDKLKKALSFNKASTGLDNLKAESAKFNLGPMEGAVTGVSKAFLAMSTIAITALSNITNKAVNAGLSMTKSLTLDPIIAGFREYELKMGSIQTILANTQRYGTTLGDVTDALNELNEYADKTIYNFGDMTKNIGLFTNAGIRIESATAMIQGFSNVAAASGTSAQGAAHAAQQLSQAMTAGVVTLMDWRSLTNVGMGNKNMQEGLIDLADAMGEFKGKSIDAKTASENFNKSLEKKWLSGDVMEQYLQIMAGKVTPAQMKSLGLTEKQIDRFVLQAKTAEEAAVKVRTATQLIGTVRESIGSGWAQTFEIIIGDFDEATELFTGINGAISNAVGATAKARNDLLEGWDKLGGRTALIEGFKAAFEALGKVMSTIKKAFRDVFPATTSQQLFDLTASFRDFMKSLIPSEQTLENIRRIFTGVFSVIKIGVTIVKGIVGVFKEFFKAIFNGSDGFLDFAGGIGDFLTKLGEMASASGIIETVFGKIGTGVGKAVGKFDSFLSVIKDVLSTLKEFASSALSGLGDIFSNIFEGFDIETLIKGVGAGGLATIGLALKKMVKDGIGVNIGGGFLDGISDALQGLTGVLQGMEQNLKANALLKIAGAIALLTASIVILASIDTDALVKAVTAIAVSFGILLSAMQVMTLIGESKGVGKAGLIAGALILIASAMLILSAAIKNLSSLSWGELLKGLTGVAAALAILTVAVKPLSASSGGMIRTGLGLIFIATAMRIMANAIKAMGALSWSEIGKGLAGVAGSLLIIAAAVRLMPNMFITSASILILSVALNAIALALKAFGSGELNEIGKGLLAMAGSLIVIAAAMHLMPKNMLLTAAGLVAVSVALNLIAAALSSMGGMTWDEIARGMVALGGSLAILAAGLYLMSGSVLGAAALAIAAASLMLLVPPLIALSTMTWGEIAKGLIALAGAITVIGVAAAIFGLGAPLLLLGGAALAVFGAGLALVGVAALAFAKAFEIAVRAAGAGAEVIRAVLDAVIESIPKAMRAFGKGVVEFVKAVGNAHSEFVKAFSKILSSLIDAITKNIPKMATMFEKLIRAGLTVINNLFPSFVTTGFNLLQKLMDGISNNVPKLVQKASDIVVKFLNGISQNLPRILAAGTNLIIKFIEGIADSYPKIIDAGFKAVIKMINGVTKAIKSNMSALRQAGKDLAYAIADGMTGGLASKIGAVVSKAREMASSAVNAVKGFLGIASPSKVFMVIGENTIAGFIKGMDNKKGDLKVAAKKVVERINTVISESKDAIRSLQDSGRSLGETIAGGLGKFGEGVASYKYALYGGKVTELKAELARLDAEFKTATDEEVKKDIGAQIDDIQSQIQAAQGEQMTPKSMLANMSQSVAELNAWSRNLETVARRGLPNQIVEELRAMGVDSAEELQALTQMTDAELKEFARLWGARESFGNKEGAKQYADDIAKEFSTMTAKLQAIGGLSMAGLAKGMADEVATVNARIRSLVTSILTETKKALGIASPSKKFMEIGRYNVEGMALGMIKYSDSVKAASEDVGDLAMTTLQSTIKDISTAFTDDVNLTPVITPVIDLTNARKGADTLGRIISSSDLTAGVTYTQAVSTASERQAAISQNLAERESQTGELKFIQNNYSPKALSTIEIYRNTRSQLSLAKEALSI